MKTITENTIDAVLTRMYEENGLKKLTLNGLREKLNMPYKTIHMIVQERSHESTMRKFAEKLNKHISEHNKIYKKQTLQVKVVVRGGVASVVKKRVNKKQ